MLSGEHGRRSFLSRFASTVMLGASLVLGATGPAFARGGGRGGGGGGYRGGGGAGAYRGGGGGGAYRGGAGAYQASAGHSVRASNVNAGNRTANVNRQGNTANVNRTGNTAAVNRTGNTATVNRGNTVNVNRGNVNVQRNTAVVRPAARPYARAPYTYGGRAFYGNRAYAYHAYRPYAWGAAWRPWGAFVGTLAATAAIVTVANVAYHYTDGVWYEPAGTGYTVVAAPIGATVETIPSGAQEVTTNNYYYGGSYYEKEGDEYTVVAPQAGTVVDELPEGGEEVTVGDRKYVKLGETYYQPIEVDGKNKYEVVEVKPEGE